MIQNEMTMKKTVIMKYEEMKFCFYGDILLV